MQRSSSDTGVDRLGPLLQYPGLHKVFLSFLDDKSMLKLLHINKNFRDNKDLFDFLIPRMTWSNHDPRLNTQSIANTIRTLCYTSDYDESPERFCTRMRSSCTLVSLTLDYFNLTLTPGMLPDTLRSLDLGDSFDQPLGRGVFPSGLTSLKFGLSFNHPIQMGVLPQGLQELRFGERFRHPLLENTLPHSLQRLFIECFIFGHMYTGEICLPHGRVEVYIREPSGSFGYSSEDSD